MNGSVRVPFFRPSLGSDEIELVTQVLLSGFLSSGPMAERFEKEFAQVTGAKHAVAVSSCTAGLQAACIASGIGPGDEVLTTAMTFCGTIQAIEESGAKPVLVDIGHDLNLDCTLLEGALTPRTRAIIPVHMAGLPCDLEALQAFAVRHGLVVIEDAAHAFGAEWRGRPIGSSSGSSAVFSFYANKNLTTGEGGMITTADPDLAARVRLFAGHGVQRLDPAAKSGWQYEVVARGFKCNMPDVLAALGVAQLRRAAEMAAARQQTAEFYTRSFAELQELELPPASVEARHAWHLYIVRLRLGQLRVKRDEFIQLLAEAGVGCSVHFRPIPMHSRFANMGPIEQWPKAQAEYPRLLSLPIFPSLTAEEREHVVAQVRRMVIRCRKRTTAA